MAFYETAAKKSAETAVRDLFQELAAWESRHVALFQRLRDELPPGAGASDIFDPDGEAEQYLRDSADSHVFLRNTDVAGLVAGCATPVNIVNLALAFEKDSVVFYTSMKRVVSPALGRETIERLIDEEITHIEMLTRKRRAFGARG
jgi:rubrerythrin